MNLKSIFAFIIFSLIYLGGFSQVIFTERPATMQLYPRKSNDSALVTIAGQVISGHYHSVIYTLYKNNVMLDSTIENLNHNGSNTLFQHQYAIHAEKSLFRIKVYLYKNNITEILAVDSISCGDIFIINGQSNAVAVANGPGSDPMNIWVRSFGSANNNDTVCRMDTSWGMANGSSANNHMSIGVWAMRLGRIISDSIGIPVCFINGSSYGSRIVDHLPLANHYDLHSPYGRLLYRANKANATSSVKGFFWYQGESDTDTAYFQYENRFNTLYNAWQQDYPGLLKIYVFQTRPGCVISIKSLYHQQLREILRKLTETHVNIKLIPTVGIPDFDGCHFLTSGYQKLSEIVFNSVGVDFYNKQAIQNNTSPNILNAFYSNNSNTSISLVFDQPVVWPPALNGYDLKDYIYLNSTATILSGFASGDTINLQLSASTNSSSITYLPGISYSGSSNIYMGPWLLNAGNVGVPTFNQFPVSNVIQLYASSTALTCNGDSVKLSTTHTGLTAKWYLNNVLITGAINMEYYAKSGGTYDLVLTDADSNSIISNSIIITDNRPPLPVIISPNGQFAFCSGGNLPVVCNASAVSYQWYKNGIVLSGSTTANYIATSSGSYLVKIQEANGCLASSAPVLITMNSLPLASVVVSNQFDVCNDSIVTLTAKNGVGYLYQWRLGSINITGAMSQIFTTSQRGSYRVVVTSSYGCSRSSGITNVPLANHFATITATGLTTFCFGNTVTLTASGGAGFNYQWLKNKLMIPGASAMTYQASVSGAYSIAMVNSMGCIDTSPAIVVTSYNCQITRTSASNSEVFNVYPNPFTDELFIQHDELIEPDTQFYFELFDIDGRLVAKTESMIGSFSEIKLNTMKLSKGLFFYQGNINGKYFKGIALKQ